MRPESQDSATTANVDSSAATSEAPPLPPTQKQDDGIKRGYVLGVVNLSHLLNHMQSGIGSVLLPIMMWQMGFDYLQLGLISSLHQLLGHGMQIIYGIVAQYYRRSMLLGLGNLILGGAGVAMGLTQTYAQVLVVRVIAGAGSSAQHPVGSTTLATYFRESKGKMLGIHHTAGNIGSLLAPALAVLLLSFLDWRMIWIVLAVPSVLMGFAYFFFGDSVSRAGSSKKSTAKIGLASYLACLRNREVMAVSAIQMVGAAGRGTGINTTYFVPFFVTALGVTTGVAGLLLALLQLGGVIGPVAIGWLSDHVGRRRTIFAVLLFSTLSTITLVFHSELNVALLLNLVIYGGVVNARGSLTQAMVADAVPDSHADAAFSLYYFVGFISGPIWTALTGYLVDSRGFTTTFLVISLTYLAGMVLIALIPGSRKAALTTAG